MTETATPPHIAGTGFDSDVSVRAVGATTWSLNDLLAFTGSQGDRIIVPAGFVTDFASSPRCLHWLISPYGAYTRAAILHDRLLKLIADYLAGLLPELPITSRDADGMFRLAMQELGVPWLKRWAMWAAVRVGALFNPQRAPGRAFAKDAPKVLAISLCAVPLLLPGVMGVLLSLGLVRVVSAVTEIPDRRKRRRLHRERAGQQPLD